MKPSCLGLMVAFVGAMLAGCQSEVDPSIAVPVDQSAGVIEPVHVEPEASTSTELPTRPSAVVEETEPLAEMTPPDPPSKPQPEPIASAKPVETPSVEPPPPAGDRQTSQVSASQGDLASEVAAFEIPPAWMANVTTKWNVAGKPWKDGRIEIRKLLGKNTEATRHEALKLMWDYKLKNDMGNGHEYGMYTFLGREPVWAVIAFREELSHPDSSFEYPPYFAAQGLASVLADYGEFEEAEQLLKRASTWKPPAPSGKFAKPNTGWTEVRQAEMHDALGDLYVAWGKTDEALQHFREAVRIYPTGKPPYGKHTLPRKAKKVQTKIDLIEGASLADANLKNGTYRANAIGYSGDVKLIVRVMGGRVADVKIDHQEKIDQGATTIIPDRIIEQQSLNVDGVTGATVTKDAIISGMLESLRKAGL